MVFRERGSSDESCVSFKILGELNEMESLFPELDVSVNAESDDEVGLGRGEDKVDGLAVHQAQLIKVRGRDGVHK